MKTPNEATVEELINDLVYWEEDANGSLLVHSLKNGGVSIYNIDRDIYAEGTTLKEALIKFGKQCHINTTGYFGTIDWNK